MQKIAINNPNCSQKKICLTLMGTEHKYVKRGPAPIVPYNLVCLTTVSKTKRKK